MPQNTLYSIAREMLENTNIYNKNISEIHFTTNRHNICTLWDCIVEGIDINSRRSRIKANNTYNIAFKSIAQGMVNYLEEYPASHSFKQKVRLGFHNWLNKIICTYNLSDIEIPEELITSFNNLDTGIVLLKELHSRDGISKDDLSSKYKVSKRAIQKSLRKLDYNLYEGAADSVEKDYVPFQIGGQPISVNIKVKDTSNSKRKLYYTPNTVHPIVMQENLMQVGTLIKSLSLNYYSNESSLSLQIAIDIWSQLSNYAKERIKKYIALNDSDLLDFISILNDECPDDRACVFRSEKDIWLDNEMSIEEALTFLIKAPNRTCSIEFEDGRTVTDAQISYASNSDQAYYELLLNNGEKLLFNKNDIKTIKPN